MKGEYISKKFLELEREKKASNICDSCFRKTIELLIRLKIIEDKKK